MKSLVHLLFCAYILLMSVLPCADSLGQLRSDGQPVLISADAHQHPQHQSDGDFCSPFCGCSCCGILLDVPSPFQFTYLQIQADPVDCFGPLKTVTSSPALTNWQPPHIG